MEQYGVERTEYRAGFGIRPTLYFVLSTPYQASDYRIPTACKFFFKNFRIAL